MSEASIALPPLPSSELLLALDFDGTISPIVDHPAAAKLDAEMRTLLAAAAVRSHVAVISGRDLEDLHQRTLGLPIYRVGSHGADCTAPGGRYVWGAEGATLVLEASLHAELVAAGFTIERKKLSLAVHFRRLASTAATTALQRFRDWALRRDLQLVAGRCVLEARVPAGDKLLALRRLMRHTRATRVFYAGDDLTDFDAITWAARHGTGVFVESSERDAPDDPAVTAVKNIESLRALIVKAIRGGEAPGRALGAA